MTTKLLTHLLGFLVQLVLLLAVGWLAKRGHYPHLDEPAPACAPTRGDAWRNSASVALALGFGAFAGTGHPHHPPPHPPHHHPPDPAYHHQYAPNLGAY
ncbi:MAG: hypothetical protein ACK5BN_15640, partial [Planctomycetota bacterium]